MFTTPSPPPPPPMEPSKARRDCNKLKVMNPENNYQRLLDSLSYHNSQDTAREVGIEGDKIKRMRPSDLYELVRKTLLQEISRSTQKKIDDVRADFEFSTSDPVPFAAKEDLSRSLGVEEKRPSSSSSSWSEHSLVPKSPWLMGNRALPVTGNRFRRASCELSGKYPATSPGWKEDSCSKACSLGKELLATDALLLTSLRRLKSLGEAGKLLDAREMQLLQSDYQSRVGEFLHNLSEMNRHLQELRHRMENKQCLLEKIQVCYQADTSRPGSQLARHLVSSVQEINHVVGLLAVACKNGEETRLRVIS